MVTRFPLFKGATRVPTIAGVPLVPAVVLVIAVASATVVFGAWWLALLCPCWLLMAQVARADDRAFRIIGLWLQTRLANRIHGLLLGGRGDCWGASTYALTEPRRRSWEGRDGRWAA